jgi:FtsH-binding integral membrane protein
MELSNESIIIIVSILGLAFLIYQNIQKTLTASRFVSTSYFYVFIAVLIVALINSFKVNKNFTRNNTMILFIGLVLSIIIMSQIENQLVKHLLWLAIIVIIGTLTSPFIDNLRHQGILDNVLVTVGTMIIVMSYFAYTQPLGTMSSWYPYLFAGLVGVLIANVANLFLDKDGFSTRTLIISGITVLLFNGFLFFDTQNLLTKANNLSHCISFDHLACANYTESSLGIFMDILNLFSSTGNVYLLNK